MSTTPTLPRPNQMLTLKAQCGRRRSRSESFAYVGTYDWPCRLHSDTLPLRKRVPRLTSKSQPAGLMASLCCTTYGLSVLHIVSALTNAQVILTLIGGTCRTTDPPRLPLDGPMDCNLALSR